MAEDSSSPSKDMIHNVFDPKGDILLVLSTPTTIGDGATSTPNVVEIQVSSTVLKLASKVFSAMLSDRFLERQQLTKKQIEGEVLRIDLPEDDPSSMLWLCRVLHNQHDLRYETRHRATLQELGKLAGLAHKYDCSKVFAPLAEYWLLPYINKHSRVQYTEQAVVLAYMFGSAMAFKGLTKTLVLQSNRSFRGICANGAGLEMTLPDSFARKDSSLAYTP